MLQNIMTNSSCIPLVGKDMDINERLLVITLRYKLKLKERRFIAVLHFSHIITYPRTNMKRFLVERYSLFLPINALSGHLFLSWTYFVYMSEAILHPCDTCRKHSKYYRQWQHTNWTRMFFYQKLSRTIWKPSNWWYTIYYGVSSVLIYVRRTVVS